MCVVQNEAGFAAFAKAVMPVKKQKYPDLDAQDLERLIEFKWGKLPAAEKSAYAGGRTTAPSESSYSSAASRSGKAASPDFWGSSYKAPAASSASSASRSAKGGSPDFFGSKKYTNATYQVPTEAAPVRVCMCVYGVCMCVCVGVFCTSMQCSALRSQYCWSAHTECIVTQCIWIKNAIKCLYIVSAPLNLLLAVGR
jgi:hypothetical protein